MKKVDLDHVDIVTSHICNKNCQFCVDRFLHSYKKFIELKDIEKFLKIIRAVTDKKLEVLLLGGEPTVLPKETLIEIANIIHSYDYLAIMSTNGVLKNKIIELVPYYDWIQITVNSDEDIEFYKPYANKINLKIAGDENLTLEKLNHFLESTKDFSRRSVTMYFKQDFEELCKDNRIWEILDSLNWVRNGSYYYAFYKGVRFKKCIHGETNVLEEPTVPKLYPNGNYNKTWNNENLDDYLTDNQWNNL